MGQFWETLDPLPDLFGADVRVAVDRLNILPPTHLLDFFQIGAGLPRPAGEGVSAVVRGEVECVCLQTVRRQRLWERLSRRRTHGEALLREIPGTSHLYAIRSIPR